MKKILSYLTNLWYSSNIKEHKEGENMACINQELESKANDILVKNDVYKLPVDLMKIASNNDIEVYYKNLPDGISGSIRYNEEKKKFQIIIEASESDNRQRFTLAHELAHYFMEREKMLYDKEIHFDPKYRKNKNPEEEEIEYLAGALLMNKNMLTKAYQVCPYVSLLASTFKVSESAMTVRLMVLGLL